MTIPVLVTGGAGYVGSHCCKALAYAGLRPIVYDNLSTGHDWAVKWGPLEQGDVLDRARLDEVIAKHKPVAALHFAALSQVGESMTQPARYWRVNVAGSLTLLEALIAAEVKCFVFSSTAAIFGIPDRVPIVEDQLHAPINPYGQSKLAVEHILKDFTAAYGLRATALRYFNAAGADAESEIGEDHSPESHLIPLVLDAAAGRRPDIAMFGEDYPTPDGTCLRDYIHVADLADAHVLALKRLIGGGETRFFNLGNGNGFSVREVIATAKQVTGRDFAVRVAARRAGDPPSLVADATQAKATLGWAPQRAALQVQIADAWRWHQSHFAG
ncbi:MAG TPA: UDP-glucose 4-epimerase GalE [Alphaproteobacteria bacterium]|nr:UDP-glucose 4-epimerase GalE [Alphaproteobacteria bacterium]